ncbi:MAG: hypothetical protein PF436_00990 [Prolixibacteraceae bacterium]|jgi:hypothetical protein|nr:hypothetical protein [Prolixibacteraceae bacterium]
MKHFILIITILSLITSSDAKSQNPDIKSVGVFEDGSQVEIKMINGESKIIKF